MGLCEELQFSLLSFCMFTFTERAETLTKGKMSLLTGAGSSEMNSVDWQQRSLWARHTGGYGF